MIDTTVQTMQDWTHQQAVDLCKQIEQFAPIYGAHVALTGGTLYKEGPRKDVDIMFYRIRQQSQINKKGLLDHLERSVGLIVGKRHGWVIKAKTDYYKKSVDLFFPEDEKLSIWQRIKRSFQAPQKYY